MDTDTTYKLFKPLNREFTFDVDVSTLPCGLNGAVYFSTMDADGGMAKYPNNKAGAKVRDVTRRDVTREPLFWSLTLAPNMCK